ncbi:MAG: hypothetical protein SVU32_00905, partial [Candidatus Nanohaloarchaea archaeon]|nr:hypothetical protein [Candidatus Nanohaloarchaea archaeon]
ALEHLQALAAALGVRELSAQDVAYRVTSVDPSALEFTDGDWDGDRARDAMPNPSDDDTDLSLVDQGFVFVPEGEEARDTKSNWKCPFRQTPDGPAHVSGLVACLAAINGARGGVEDISEEVLRDGYDFVVDALVAAGHYDDRDEAPAFEATASDDSSTSTTDDGLEATDPIAAELTAQATGVIDAGPDAAALLEGADDGGPLMGVIWGAGDHDLSVGGEPTPVRVPEETVPPTFEALQDDVAAGEVTLGFDHPGEDSVAAQTGIVEIGVAENVALSEDERHIVLTDSELTNDQAIEAAEEGAFDDLDWSVVGDVRIRRDDDGDPVRIRRIDAVTEGAVDAASIARDRDALPDLQSELQTIQQAAQSPNQQTISAAADALRASADALDDHDMDHFDPDDYDDISEALEAASDVVTE